MFLDRFLDLVFPPSCLSCRRRTKSNEVVCGNCLAAIPLNRTLFCGKCGARLAEGRKICHRDFPYVLGAATCYSNAAVKNLIHALKFKYVRGAAKPLGDLLAGYAEALPLRLEKFTVIPLPLHARRLRERGFNQSELIAGFFAKRLDLPLETEWLERAKHAKPQSETKNLAERKENIRGSFVVKNTTNVSGKNIILVDDVTTSGATFYEAALVLKSAGARKIIALAAARA